MQICQDNLIYLSGPHGSGKSTLATELQKENPKFFIPELLSKSPKFNIEPEYRLILKICERAIENFEYLKIAKENPDRIVLANRCIYDCLAYNLVFYKKRWISQELYYTYDIYDFFRNENSNPRAIIINPNLDIILKHLKKRWNRNNKKWREDDFEYTKLANEEYKRFKGFENILYIEKEIDLESRLEINNINEWCENKVNEKEKYTLTEFSY